MRDRKLDHWSMRWFCHAAVLWSLLLVTSCSSKPGKADSPKSEDDDAQVGQTVEIKPTGEYATIDTSGVQQLDDKLLHGNAADKDAALKSVLAAPEKYPPPVLYCTSMALMQQGKKDDAVFWFLAGQLRCKYDANRCADESARTAVSDLDDQFAPEIIPYMKTIKSRVPAVANEVVAWDTKTPYKYDHRWINLHGLAPMIAAGDKQAKPEPLSVPQSQWDAIAKKTRADFLEGYR